MIINVLKSVKISVGGKIVSYAEGVQDVKSEEAIKKLIKIGNKEEKTPKKGQPSI